MILVIGEILMDMIGSSAPSSLKVEGKLGGAPLNVASDLSDLGIEATFHGVLGNDIIGNFLKDQLKGHKPNLRFALRTREDRQTTIAFFLKDKGDFQFLRKLGADYSFEASELLDLPFKEAKIIHFGSLFLSSMEAREKIFLAIGTYKKQGKLISFDVNFRSDIFGEEDYLAYYEKMISYADIVKFTKEELLMLSGESDMVNALRKYEGKKIVLITDGSKGSYCFYGGKLFFAPSVAVQPVDTIGCGDSFMAGVLSYLHEKDIDALSDSDVAALLARGNECGKRTCLVQGALHAYESLEDVEAKA